MRRGVVKTDYKALALGRLRKATSFFSTPAYATKKKAAAGAKKRKAPTAAEKAADKKHSYRELVVEAIRATAKPVKGASLLAIVAYLAKHHAGKAERHHIRQALRTGVASGVFKKTKASYRVAAGVAGKPKRSRAKKPAAAAASSTAATATKKRKPAGGAKPAKKAARKSAATATTTTTTTTAKRGAAAAAAVPAKRGAAAAATTTTTDKPALTKRASSLTSKKAKVFDSSTVAPVVGDIIWEYEHGTWRYYDKAASDILEAAYQEWLKNPYTDVRAVKSGQWEYQVDFTNMLQTNIQHEAHTQRKIRRHLFGEKTKE